MRALITTAVALLCVSAAAAADEDPAGEVREAVEVSVGAVVASNRGDELDHRLTAMRRQFSSFFSYSSYRLVDQQRQRIPWGKKRGFDVPGGRYVVVSPREFKNKRVVMKVLVLDGRQAIVDTTVALRDHGTFLVGGQRHPEGVLILAIGAHRVP